MKMNALFDLIAKPFGYLMEFCLKISPNNNYLVALIFFTIIIQLLLCLLFGIKQQKNSVKQATLAPKVAAIRKKYAGRNDQQTMMKMQEETQALYQAHGYNQLGGCLPMLIQLPIIMALYNVIVAPLQHMLMLTKAEVAALLNKFLDAGLLSDAATKNIITEKVTEFTEKNITNARVAQTEVINIINKWRESGATEKLEEIAYGVSENLTAETILPNYNAFGLDFSLNPPYPNASDFGQIWPLIIVPVLIVVTMILSQNIMRKFTYQDPMMKEQQNNGTMKFMTYSMPLLSAFISFSLPAAVGVYWVYRSVVATVQQIILYALIPPPKFTEEDYKAAEREISGKDKNKKKKNTTPRDPNAPKKRSLHHIDDEDEAPAPAPVKAARTEEELEEAVAEEKEPSSLVKEAPVMKDDKGSHYKKK
ncbi:MAG: YidC/Oxa1 family membrane protein insertase [Clostridia bacterium]|nr:YidC/Oxa1 family membrane protein insertase [Clostridia bacterium]